MYILQIKIILKLFFCFDIKNKCDFSEEMQLDIDMQWIEMILFSKI